MFISEMTRKMVNLNSIEKVKEFVSIANSCTCDIDIISGHHIIDAKSIMGVFSLNLSKPVECRIYDKAEIADTMLAKLKDFIVGEAPENTDPYAK